MRSCSVNKQELIWSVLNGVCMVGWSAEFGIFCCWISKEFGMQIIRRICYTPEYNNQLDNVNLNNVYMLQDANIAFYVEGNATSFGEEDSSVGAAASGAKGEGGGWVDCQGRGSIQH